MTGQVILALNELNRAWKKYNALCLGAHVPCHMQTNQTGTLCDGKAILLNHTRHPL